MTIYLDPHVLVACFMLSVSSSTLDGEMSELIDSSLHDESRLALFEHDEAAIGWRGSRRHHPPHAIEVSEGRSCEPRSRARDIIETSMRKRVDLGSLLRCRRCNLEPFILSDTSRTKKEKRIESS